MTEPTRPQLRLMRLLRWGPRPAADDDADMLALLELGFVLREGTPANRTWRMTFAGHHYLDPSIGGGVDQDEAREA